MRMGATEKAKDSKDGWIKDLGEDTAADAAQLARREEELGGIWRMPYIYHKEKACGMRPVRVQYAPSILPDHQLGPIDSFLGLVRSRRTAVARRKCCSNRLTVGRRT